MASWAPRMTAGNRCVLVASTSTPYRKERPWRMPRPAKLGRYPSSWAARRIRARAAVPTAVVPVLAPDSTTEAAGTDTPARRATSRMVMVTVGMGRTKGLAGGAHGG